MMTLMKHRTLTTIAPQRGHVSVPRISFGEHIYQRRGAAGGGGDLPTTGACSLSCLLSLISVSVSPMRLFAHTRMDLANVNPCV